MNDLPICIANSKFLLDSEKEIIYSIYDSFKNEFPEGSLNEADHLMYNAKSKIIISEQTGESKAITLYTDLSKCSSGMKGQIQGNGEYINDFTDVNGTIHIAGVNESTNMDDDNGGTGLTDGNNSAGLTDDNNSAGFTDDNDSAGLTDDNNGTQLIDLEVTGQISLKCQGINYSGDIKGKSVCKGFTPIFTCISDLYSDDKSRSLHLDCTFASKITQLCSDHKLYEELSDKCKKLHIDYIPYEKYISGWKKIGHSYRYISPETHTSIIIPENRTLSSENIMNALQYIDNDMGTLVFFHSVRSLVFRFFKPKYQVALNIKCDLELREEAIKYISSIVNFFGSPNITKKIPPESFALNHKFKITKIMPNINGLKKDTRLFKDFPVFLFGKRRKTDFFHPDTSPQPEKTKIRQSVLDSMLKSDISYIFLNAYNKDQNIMNFNCRQDLVNFDDNAKFIFKRLIQEYICYLEDIINCTLVISHKNKKLINLHNELFFEARYEAFDEFLINLRSKIKRVADSYPEDYITLCQHISYTDVIKFYKDVKYNMDRSDADIRDIFSAKEFNEIFGEYVQDIINRSEISSRDMKYLEKVKIFTYYFDDLDDEEAEINRMVKESIPKKDKKKLEKFLESKFELYLTKYHARLIAQFAGSMKYNMYNFGVWHKYAKDIMNTHKQECGKPTLKYCTELLASAYGFVLFLRDKYDIPEETGNHILKRVESLYIPIEYNGELKVPDKAQLVQFFREFLGNCLIKKKDHDTGSEKRWYPIYEFVYPKDKNEKYTTQHIGWYDMDKSEYALIKRENSPVELTFKSYLNSKNYDSNFVWSTFVREQLCPEGIIKKSCQKTHPYESSRKIDGIKHIVYIMHLTTNFQENK